MNMKTLGTAIPSPLHPAADSIVMPELARAEWINNRLNITLARNGAAPATIHEVAMGIFAANGIDANLNYRYSSTGNWDCYSCAA